MAIPTSRRVGGVFYTACRRTSTTSCKPLKDKPDHKQTSCKDRQAWIMFPTLLDRTDCFCGSGSRIGIHITLYKPPSPVICHSFHTSKMTGTHQEQLIDHLRLFLVFIEFNFYCTFQGTEDSRTQHLPSQHHPHPHHPEEGSHRVHGSCPGYCRERRGPDLHYFLLGDDSFALMLWLVKPYSRCQLTREEGIANCRISRGWRVVENSFSILVKRFRVLLITMEQRPKVVRDIVLTRVVLHNMLRSHQGRADRRPTPADDMQPQQGDQGEERHQEHFRNPWREAKHHRDLLKDYFNHVGLLAGQEDRV